MCVFMRVVLFFFIVLFPTFFIVDKLTPSIEPLVISENRFETIGTQKIEGFGDIIIGKSGKIDLAPELARTLKEKITGVQNQYKDTISPLPAFVLLFFKFDLDLIYQDSSIKYGNYRGKFELWCNGNTQINKTVKSYKSVTLNAIRETYLESSLDYLEKCRSFPVEDQNKLPEQYTIQETYKFVLTPQFINYLLIFLIVTTGFFGLLPIWREGVKALRIGANYFKK